MVLVYPTAATVSEAFSIHSSWASGEWWFIFWVGFVFLFLFAPKFIVAILQPAHFIISQLCNTDDILRTTCDSWFHSCCPYVRFHHFPN